MPLRTPPQVDSSRMSAAQPRTPGTGFLDAETEPPKSPLETTDARRDRKTVKPVAEIAAQTAYLNLKGNYPVQKDWLVAEAVLRNGSPSQ